MSMRKHMAPIAALGAVGLAATMTFAAVAHAAGKEERHTQDTMKRTEAHSAETRPSAFTEDEWRSMAASTLAVRVQSELAASASLRSGDISVETDGEGQVVLSGTVRSEQQKERAARIARGTPGVTEVENEIEVDESFAAREPKNLDDDELVRRVAEEIANELNGKVEESWLFGYSVTGKTLGRDWSIDVEADGGEIELDGHLSTNAEVQKALQAAQRVPAVRSIENALGSVEMRRLGYAPSPYRPVGWARRGYGTHSATLVGADGGQRELVCRYAAVDTQTRAQ